MTIISVSLSDEYTEELDIIQETYNLKGRSEAIRASISSAMGEIKELDKMEGIIEGVLIIVRSHHEDPWMMQIQGRYQDHIKTQMHSHLQNHKCLEVMVVSCNAPVLKDILSEIRAQGKADYVKFVRG